MRLRLAFFFIVLSGTSLANQSSFNEIENVPNLDSTTIQSTKYDGILSVFLYLPLLDDNGLSSTMSQSQMTVTPGQTYAGIRGIYIRAHSSTNGTCSGTASTSYGIDNSVGVTVTLQSGHAYTTTDASNWALNQIGASSFTPQNDVEFGLLDNTLGLIGGSLQCIQGSGSNTCTTSSNCGWNTTRSWTP
ncbi:MAG: hypothetical protein NTW94_00520 [Legionellales bacterium]|nr:hypothetical protein [Legionellales bacterium]